MIRHSIRKVFALIVLYSAVILGLCALQFRSGHVINKSAGGIRLTLRETVNQAQESILENNFQIVYKGLVFFADESRPVTEFYESGEKSAAELASYEVGEQSLTLNFAGGSSITFSERDGYGDEEGRQKQLEISAVCASPDMQLLLPCRTANGYTTTNDFKHAQVVVSSKSSNYALSSLLTAENEVPLYAGAASVYFAAYTPVDELSYQIIASSALAQPEAYADTIRQFRSGFAALHRQNASDAGEKEIAAFIAEAASQGGFAAAVKSENAAIKFEGRKTHLTTPYFGNLEATSKMLATHYKNLLYKAQTSAAKANLDAFEIAELVPMLVQQNKLALAESLFEFVASQEGLQPSALQLANILNAYCDCLEYAPQLAQVLSPKIPSLLDGLLSSLEYSDPLLAFKPELEEPSQADVCRLGAALLRYGAAAAREELCGAGRVLISSSLKTKPAPDALACAELYPVLVENGYYPHLAVLAQTPANVTVWTCAPEVSLSSPQQNKLEIDIKFQVGESHYLIINGIRAFNEIELYGLKYRSDKQFERYDSPGYVYDFATQTLLLKMRHKAELEKVVLTYSSQAAYSAGALGQGKLGN